MPFAPPVLRGLRGALVLVAALAGACGELAGLEFACNDDSDCASGYHCADATCRKDCQAGACMAAAATSSSAEPASSTLGGSSSSTGPTSSSGVSSTSSSASPSSSAEASSSLAATPSSSSAAVSSSSGAPSSSSESASSSSAEAPSSSSAATSLSSAGAPSSSAASSSSSAASSSSYTPCQRSPLEPECGTVALEPRFFAGGKRWAPKTNALAANSVGLGAKGSHAFHVFDVGAENAGDVLFNDDVHHTPSGPAASMVAHGGGKVIVTFSDHEEFRIYGPGTGIKLELFNGHPGDVAPHTAPVVMAETALPTTVAAREDVLAVVTVGVSSSTVASRTLSTGSSERGYAARACQPGRGSWAVVDADQAVQVHKLLESPGGTNSLDALPGDPAIPPIVIDSASAGARVVTFRNDPDVLTLRQFPFDYVLDHPSAILPGLTASAPAAAFPLGALAGVAIPTEQGVLVLVNLTSGSVLQVDLGSEALGGVVVADFSATGDDSTFFVGDAGGRVHAVRGGRELTEYGWPWLVSSDLAITQTPALVRVEPGPALHLVVLGEEGDDSKLAVLRLGEGAADAALTWPEYQHDQENTGCLTVP